MPEYSEKSRRELNACHEDLQKLFYFVIQHFDCSVIEDHRNKERQNLAYRAGNTKLEYPHSKHNQTPSLAVDVIPYPVDWTDLKRMYYFAGFVMATAVAMNIPLRWGGDWDRDTEVIDNRFNDLCHFELM
jgi:peptidoglycan L-alanyl-D-glutamate endopeptidase CwlK